MLKKFLYSVLILAMVLSLVTVLASCGGDDTGSGNDDQYHDDGGSAGNDDVGGDSQTPSGTAKLFFDADNIVSCPLSNGKFDLSSISHHLNREGYTYKGIYDAETGGALVVSTGGDFLMVLEKDIVLYPRFEALEYTLQFSTEVGRLDAGKETMSLKTGSAISLFPTPLYDENKYDFLGWEYNGELISDKTIPLPAYKNFNFGLADPNTPISITARFAPAVLKVIFDYNNGSYEQKIYETEYGAEFTFEFPTLTGLDCEVEYWSEDPAGSVPYYPDTIKSSITLYAIWIDYKEVEFYSLTDTFETRKYKRGQTIDVPFPERAGYEFDGWYTSPTFSGNPVTSFGFGTLAKKYYARWTPIQYDLKLFDGDKLYTSYQYSVEDELVFPSDLAKTGYTFNGWKDSAGNFYTKKEIGQVLNGDLHAFYTPDQYTITYRADGQVVSTAVLEYDSKIEFFIPEKLGYKFTGYQLDGVSFTDTTYTETRDITLDACFEVIKYKIEYVLYGAENGAGNVLEYTVHDSIRFADAFKEFYSFEGWYSDAGFENYYDEILAGTVGDITLYARFRGLSYAALLDPVGGECQRDKVVLEYDAPFTIPVCVREGYSFDGWFTTPEGEGEQLTDAEGKSLGVWNKGVLETTIYARYTKRHYITIKTNYPAAYELTMKEYYLVGELVTLNVVYDNGYMFLGYRQNDADGAVVNYSAKYQFRMPDGDVQLYLEFNPNIYKISLNSGDAYCTNTDISVDYGQLFTLPIAFLDGKQFVGWKYGDTFITGADGVATDNYFFKEDIVAVAEFVDSTAGAKLIYTFEDLLTIADNPGGTFVLVNDISVAGRIWTPIDFTGTIDGLNHKISGLTSPLFNSVNGTVKNLTVEVQVELTNIEANRLPFGALAYYINGGTLDGVITTGTIVTHGKYGVGGFAYELKSATLTNCKNYVTITTDGDGDYTGGFFSLMTSGTIKNCENHGTITGINNVGGFIGWLNGGVYRENTNHGTVIGNENVGGFAGRTGYAGSYTMESVHITNKGTITGNTNVGGIFGLLSDERSDHYADYSFKLTHLYNTGSINGGTNVGGIAGRIQMNNPDRYSLLGYFENWENTGNITATSYAGGLIGKAYSDHGSSYLKNSSSKNCSVTAEYMVGGLAGYMENVWMKSCSNEGMTVTATGYLLDGTTYYAYLGGYAGYATSIEYCDNAVELVYTQDGRFVGGIAGKIAGTINYCNNTANITAVNSDYVGGLGGLVSVGGNRKHSNASNAGDITGASHVGGLFGQIEDIQSDHYSYFTMELTLFKNTGKITASGDYAGGIAGVLKADNPDRYGVDINATVFENHGEVSGNAYVGGICGFVTADNRGGILSLMENYATVTGNKNLGGVFGVVYSTPISKAYNYAEKVVCEALDGAENIGGVIGYTTSDLDTIENYAVVSNPNANMVGGIVGQLSGGLIGNVSNLTNHAAITGKDHVGGVIGYFSNSRSDHYSDFSVSFSNLLNNAEVIGNNNVGGLVGHLLANNPDRYSFSINFSDSKNTANVTGVQCVGGVVGYAYSDTRVNMVRLEAKNITVTGETYVGGLVGKGEQTDLTDCYNDGSTVNATGYFLDGTTYYAYVGGFAGYFRSGTNLTNGVTINYTGIGRYVGGIAGYATGGLTSCTNNASVTAENADYVGGIAGRINSGSGIKECANTGAIIGKSYVGGITGELSHQISDHYADHTTNLEVVSNTGTVTGINYVAGLFGNYSVNNPDRYSYSLIATSLSNTGDITGETYVGGWMGCFYSDGGSSVQLSTSTGTITGTENADQFVGKNTNLTIS